ncbi:hypothetical protein N658DRAFT_561031 [Parathielavia hyrcaniae]|uniref:RTA1 domain-containing protein n=1 Tax=Parathielavia hyrcaniae TaxID=113614 RepID=A0AAN6PV31_9PEZI|nr:hypothetical protein N658DRAFT_561031 [Parathielavia hyrcaniae]
MADGEPVPNSVYFYAPNKGAPIFFAAAFAIAGLCSLWQSIRHKLYKLAALLPLCCAFLTAAYATRSYGAFHYEDAQVYTASTMLVYMSPPLLQLTNNYILGRVFKFVPYFAPMHPAPMLLTFISLAAVAELLTVPGIAYLSNPNLPAKSLAIGDTLTKASLVLQLLIAAVFFLMAGIFHRCCRAGGIRNPRVMRPLVISYASMLLLVARTIFRCAEHFAGVPPWSGEGVAVDPSSLSPVVRYEWYFYVFDAALVLVATVVWNVGPPGRFLPADRRAYLAQDGVTVLRGPEWKDSRSLTETFFNPFAMLTTRGGHQKQFWESNGYALRSTRRGAGVV